MRPIPHGSIRLFYQLYMARSSDQLLGLVISNLISIKLTASIQNSFNIALYSKVIFIQRCLSLLGNNIKIATVLAIDLALDAL